MTDKQTSKDVGGQASDVLRDDRTADDSKTAGGSALSQRQPDRQTSEDAASASSEVLRDDSTSDRSKASAASTLSQKEKS